MTLTTFVSLSAIISNLAVFISLILVMRQIRQNGRHQQATMRHGRVQQLQMIYQQAAQDDFIDVVLGGLAGDVRMSGPDCNRFVWFANTIFNMFENLFDQHRDGIVDKRAFASSNAAMRSQLAMPGVRAAWMVSRGRYQKDFTDYVDALMADTPIDGVADASAAWRAFVPKAAPAAGG
jgi:hypothetical protein